MSDPKSTQCCPRCGARGPLGDFLVCAPCAAAEGWDPECSACLGEQRGVSSVGHVATCGGSEGALVVGRGPDATEARTDGERWLSMARDASWLRGWLEAHGLPVDAAPASVVAAVGYDYQGYSVVAEPDRCHGLVGERNCKRARGHVGACVASVAAERAPDSGVVFTE